MDPHPVVTAIYTLAMILVLTQRLALDRAEKQRLAGDLEAARTVQNLLLTPGEENARACAIETVYVPAQEVGGDFYQVLPDADGSVLVVVGDVSGKGLRAAMVVSMLIGVARTHRKLSPAALLEQMNEALSPAGGGFVTCAALRLSASGDGALANAGHLAPFRNGVEMPVESELPLGVMSGVRYEETHFSFGPEDQLTFCTDGVVEAENAQRELFGFDRTRAISTQSAQEIADAAQQWGQTDDITVVTVRSKA